MVLIALGIAGILAGLVCCGGFGLMGYYFKNAVSDDPTVIAELAKGIAELDIPETLEPVVSVNFTKPFSDEQLMAGVVYADESANSIFVLGSVGRLLEGSGQSPEQFMEQIEDALDDQDVQQELNVDEWERTEREIVVRGQPTTFQFATGEDVEQQRQYIQVTGTFEGENGQAMIMFIGDAEKYSEETVVEMLESVR